MGWRQASTQVLVTVQSQDYRMRFVHTPGVRFFPDLQSALDSVYRALPVPENMRSRIPTDADYFKLECLRIQISLCLCPLSLTVSCADFASVDLKVFLSMTQTLM